MIYMAIPFFSCFNTQPPEGGWLQYLVSQRKKSLFQHTAARRRLVMGLPRSPNVVMRFNTQPPEGGWTVRRRLLHTGRRFNTQPPEGGWMYQGKYIPRIQRFNTQPPEGGWPRK